MYCYYNECESWGRELSQAHRDYMFKAGFQPKQGFCFCFFLHFLFRPREPVVWTAWLYFPYLGQKEPGEDVKVEQERYLNGEMKNALSLDDWVKEKQRLSSTQTGMLEFGAGAGQRRRKQSSFLSGTKNCITPPALRAWPFSPCAALSSVSRSMNNVQLLSLPRVQGKHLEIHST